MRKHQFEEEWQKIQKEVCHMFNSGATRETTIKYVIARVIRANTIFSSDQLREIFELVLQGERTW